MSPRRNRRVRRLPVHDWAWHEAQMAQGPQGLTAQVLIHHGLPVTWDSRKALAERNMTKIDRLSPARRALVHQFGPSKAPKLAEWNAKRSSTVSVAPEALGL
jgi:hypothetical protein